MRGTLVVLSVCACGSARPIALMGSVVMADGHPAAGAEVALVRASGVAAHVTADQAGRWRLTTPPGTWGVSASTATASGFLDRAHYADDTRDVHVVIRGGVTIRGHTHDMPVPGTFVALSLPNEHSFVVPIAADGTFTTQLPNSRAYAAQVIDNGIGSVVITDVASDPVDLELPIATPTPPPHEVVEWIGAHAFPLATTEAGHGLDDLAPLGNVVGTSHVVALGEATHGTREFFQLKHRVLEFLVAKLGFTVFAIEANEPECRAVDAYIMGGSGDAKAALAGLGFWTWNTEEVLAMIEWMRTWNADPAHAKVRFAGIDMQASRGAHANVVTYLREVGMAQLAAPLGVLGRADSETSVHALSPATRARLGDGLAAVEAAFESHATAWAAIRTTLAYEDARHEVALLAQATARYTAAPGEASDLRDRAMADNIAWLRQHAPEGARLVVWAHNGHIGNALPPTVNMGSYLRARYERDYTNIGFIFGDGSFQAIDYRSKRLREFTVGGVPTTDGSIAFSRTGKPLLVLDLHAVPEAGVVHDWFASTHTFRIVGSVFESGLAAERAMNLPATLPHLYDAVIFVAHTTRARPLH